MYDLNKKSLLVIKFEKSSLQKFIFFFFLSLLESLKPIDIKETESSCNCQGYATCEWSTQLVNQLSFLPQNHPLWKHNSIFFNQRICDRPNQYVWCCREGDFPRESELNILNKKDVDLVSTTKAFKIVTRQALENAIYCQ